MSIQPVEYLVHFRDLAPKLEELTTYPPGNH
jgi:hypothetical protein